jgi:hypothetical protein
VITVKLFKKYIFTAKKLAKKFALSAQNTAKKLMQPLDLNIVF